MASPIRFGTDGWRAIIAEDFTFANVRLCAQGVANYLIKTDPQRRGLVVGYDTRFASAEFAAAVAEVIAGNDLPVYLCQGPNPTPVVSHSILDLKAAGAAIITASHNPPLWNGFKYKPDYAGSASPEVIAALEAEIDQVAAEGTVKRIPLEMGQQQGLIRGFDPKPAYIHHVSSLVDLSALQRAGLKVVVDPMYGTGAGYITALLAGGTTEVIELNAEPNPAFPGIHSPEPIAHNLHKLSAAVKELGAHVGLATDGDADRLGIVDESGNFINQLQAFALLALYMLETRGERGPIVKSLTTTSMVLRLGELYGQPVYETAVGFKYLGPQMEKVNAIIAGEESGGYAFRDHIPERDGILAGLFILDMMVRMGKSPSQLIEHLYSLVGPHYYDRIDLEFPPEEREAILKRLASQRPDELAGILVSSLDTQDGFRFTLADGAWLLVRFSGTEPLLRIYTEANRQGQMRQLLEEGRRLAGL